MSNANIVLWSLVQSVEFVLQKTFFWYKNSWNHIFFFYEKHVECLCEVRLFDLIENRLISTFMISWKWSWLLTRKNVNRQFLLIRPKWFFMESKNTIKYIKKCQNFVCFCLQIVMVVLSTQYNASEVMDNKYNHLHFFQEKTLLKFRLNCLK